MARGCIARALVAWALGLAAPGLWGGTAEEEAAARERLAALRAEIAHHDDLYFRQAAPEITDADYDRLKRELAALERAHPDWAQLVRVGDDRSGRFPTHAHRVAMLSLDKAYTEAEWRAFHAGLAARLGRADLRFVVEPKYDGLGISLIYEHGLLTHAVTRGNGLEGDDVTANVRALVPVRSQLRPVAPDGSANPIPAFVELRGEVYVDDAEFNRLNAVRAAEGADPFAHPRNLAAGTLRSLDAEEIAARRLCVVIYGWGAWEEAPAPASQQAFHAQVRAWGLPGVGKFDVVDSADAAWQAICAFAAARTRLGFPVDGAVVKLDDVARRAQLGESDHAPRWAIAYKYEADRAITRVRAITIQVGRTGALTPVAELEPVVLGRTTVARATLHNREALARRDVRVGDYVEIEKAGEVIPSVGIVFRERRAPGSVPFAFPVRCPGCDAPVETRPGEAVVRCTNPRCPAQQERRLEHFASASAVDISGLGPATIGILVREGLVRSPADFYRLKAVDLDGVAGIGTRGAERLLAAIERSRRAALWRYICGLGIPRIGAVNARKLAAACSDLDDLARLSPERLKSLLGEAAATEVVLFFRQPANADTVRDLAASRRLP